MTILRMFLSLLVVFQVLGDHSSLLAVAQDAKVADPKLLGDAQSLEKLLNSRITVSFHGKPVRECIGMLATQLKVTIVFHEEDLLRHPLATAHTVRLKLTDCKFRSALNALMTDTAWAWETDTEQIHILSRTKAERIVSRSHPTADLAMSGLSARQIAGAVVSTIDPEAWDFMGGPGRLRSGLQTLEVEQSAHIHDAIHALLEDLRSAKSVAKPLRSPVPRLQSALEAVVAQECSGKALSTVLQDLLAESNLVVEKLAILNDGFDMEQPISGELKGLPVHVAISKILDQASLVWYIDDDLLRVTSERTSSSRLRAGVFRLPKPGASQSHGELVKELVRVVDPGNWRETGGSGSVFDKIPGILIIRHSPPTLRKIETHLNRPAATK